MANDGRWYENAATAAQRRKFESSHSAGSDLEGKYPIALLLYSVLAVLVWFTIGEGKVVVFHRLIEVRLVPILILATFAFRTVLACRRTDPAGQMRFKGLM